MDNMCKSDTQSTIMGVNKKLTFSDTQTNLGLIAVGIENNSDSEGSSTYAGLQILKIIVIILLCLCIIHYGYQMITRILHKHKTRGKEKK